MRRRNLSRLWIWLVVALLVVTCGWVSLRELTYRPTPLFPPCEAGCPGAQRLRLPVGGMTDIRTLDPPNVTDPTLAQFAGIIFPGLLVLNKDLNPIPWAATALPDVSSDGLTWTFHVRPGVKWSDGAAIDATTYAFSMNRAENPCNAFGAAYYLYAIKDAAAFNSETCDTTRMKVIGPLQTLINDSITAPDPRTLVVRLARPATYFLYAMTYPTSYAVPVQLVQLYGNKYVEHLADGSGFGGDLFKVTRWDHTGRLVLRRNDNFWGVKPKLLEVDVTFYKSADEAYSAFQKGKEDVGYAPLDQFTQARKHATFQQIATQTIDYYGLSWKMAPFNDIRMRQAFAIALNKNALAQDIYSGSVYPTNHIVPLGTPGYNPALLGPDGTTSLSGDTKLANQLATAYATDKKCGTASDFSKCPPINLTLYIGDTPAGQDEAAAAQQMWLKAMPNYPITISEYQGGLLQTLGYPKFQFWSSAWIGDYPDPQDWLSTNLSCASAYNTGDVCDKQADTLMAQADANPDRAARLAQYQQAEQLLVTEVAWIPLDQTTAWWETGSGLQNFTIAATAMIPRESWQTIYVVPSS